jgi:hypothetical protein
MMEKLFEEFISEKRFIDNVQTIRLRFIDNRLERLVSHFQ